MILVEGEELFRRRLQPDAQVRVRRNVDGQLLLLHVPKELEHEMGFIDAPVLRASGAQLLNDPLGALSVNCSNQLSLRHPKVDRRIRECVD